MVFVSRAVVEGERVQLCASELSGDGAAGLDRRLPGGGLSRRPTAVSMARVSQAKVIVDEQVGEAPGLEVGLHVVRGWVKHERS